MKKQELEKQLKQISSINEDQKTIINNQRDEIYRLRAENKDMESLIDAIFAMMEVTDLSMEWKDAVFDCSDLDPAEMVAFMSRKKELLDREQRIYRQEVREIANAIKGDECDARSLVQSTALYFDECFEYESNLNSLLDFIKEGKGKCWHIAHLFSDILSVFNIPSSIIYGVSKGERHVWNSVIIDGKEYNFDITWAMTAPDEFDESFLFCDDDLDFLHDHIEMFRDVKSPLSNTR